VGNDRPPNRKRHVVAMKWQIAFGVGEVRLREPVLIVEPVRRRAVELVGARLGGHHFLHAGGAAVFARIRIHLHTGFLDRLWIRRQVQYALPDAAGDVEAVDYVHVRHLPLTIGAGVRSEERRVGEGGWSSWSLYLGVG